MLLAVEITKYINHKLRLAQVSAFYQRPQIRQSIDWACNLRQALRFNASSYGERDLAQLTIQCQQHLYKLLPAEANKSYRSSLENYHKILNYCKTVLQPKS